MKEWSSQLTQFMQLRREAWKKVRTSTGFEPVTSRLPVRCSTNWAMKPLTGKLQRAYLYWPLVAVLKACIKRAIYLKSLSLVLLNENRSKRKLDCYGGWACSLYLQLGAIGWTGYWCILGRVAGLWINVKILDFLRFLSRYKFHVTPFILWCFLCFPHCCPIFRQCNLFIFYCTSWQKWLFSLVAIAPVAYPCPPEKLK